MSFSNPGIEWFGGFAQNLATLVVKATESVLGVEGRNGVSGELRSAQWIAALVFVLFFMLADGILFGVLRCWKKGARKRQEQATWWQILALAVGKPLHLAVWLLGIYFSIAPLLMEWGGERSTELQNVFVQVLNASMLVVVIWLFFRLGLAVERRLRQWAAKSEKKLDDLLVGLLGKSLRVIVPVISVILVLPALGLPGAYGGIISKTSSILIVGAISWSLFQAVGLVSAWLMTQYDITAADNLRARGIYTQVTVLKKTLYFTIGLFTIASVLMLFEEVRRLGASILASAGIAGIIIGFAAQKAIANLFAGFQIAMTQPIRLEDVVIVEGEWGNIEEITLTYVVVRIWDLRRLILPISYFIEKPFQNWTRTSADILGTVLFYVDYTMPVETLRLEARRIVEQSPAWDKRVCQLQVTDAKERSVELRVLASASDAGKAWNLRCEIREKLLAFIQQNFPESLPQMRGQLMGNRDPALPSGQDRRALAE